MRNTRMRSVASSMILAVVEAEENFNRLPEDVQRHIVSILPMQDAVRTSILSKKWRKVWYSLSRLNFDYRDFPNMERKPERFAEFIDHTLFHHDGSDIETIVLRTFVNSHQPCPRISSEWVTYAIQHNVQNLTLYGLMKEQQRLPNCLFTCKSLIRLELSVINYALKWPTTIVLPNLKILTLRSVAFTEENVSLELSSTCPILDSLTMLFCNLSPVKLLAISAPIKHLDIFLCRRIFRCLIKLRTPSLKEFEYNNDVARDFDFATISPEFSALVKFHEPILSGRSSDDLNRSVLKFYKEFRNVTKLMVDEWFIKLLSQAYDLLEFPATSFCNLVNMKITIWPIKEHLQMLIIFLSRCPNLRALKIVISSKGCPPDVSTVKWENVVNRRMLDHLECIIIKNLDGGESGMELVKFMLLNSCSLTEMKVMPPRKGVLKLMAISDEKWMKIRGKLLEFKRASTNAVVSFF